MARFMLKLLLGSKGVQQIIFPCRLYCCDSSHKIGLLQNGAINNLIQLHPKLKPNNVKKRIEQLKLCGVKENDIVSHPEILLLGPSDVTYNVSQFKGYNLDEETYGVLLSLPSITLSKYYSVWRRDLRDFSVHRVLHLANQLKLSQKETIELTIKYKFLVTINYSNVRATLETLLKYGVRPEDIVTDPWVLRCKADNITKRLDVMKGVEVEEIKPWMVRCPEKVFNDFLTRVSFKNKLLGDLSLEEYLSRRLDCTVDDIKKIIVREPQLQKTSVLKMQKILDFLFSVGFTASQIITGLPRVANRRIETIHARLVELNQVGIPPSLYVISKSKREYQEYVNKRKGEN